MKPKVVKKKKLSIKKILILFLVLYLLGCLIYYIVALPIKNIVITGTKHLEDVNVIEIANIKDYPSMFKSSSNSLEKKLEKDPLIKNADVSKNIFGKLSIEIEENKILFFDRNMNKLILENQESIDLVENVYGVPSLINRVPNEIYEKLVENLIKIDDNILSLISEIEYNPLKSEDTIIDDSRFLLRMNDGNHVYINMVNIKKINTYDEIYVSLDNKKGTINMDSSTEENFYFIEFGSEVVIEEVPSESGL